MSPCDCRLFRAALLCFCPASLFVIVIYFKCYSFIIFVFSLSVSTGAVLPVIPLNEIIAITVVGLLVLGMPLGFLVKLLNRPCQDSDGKTTARSLRD